MNKIGIIDYKMGNITSLVSAFDQLGYEHIYSDRIAELEECGLLFLPGVGAAPDAMKNLQELGLDTFLKDWVRRGKPLMGICLGMQLFFDYSEEGDVKCLGLISGEVKKFDATKKKVPHIGWNTLRIVNGDFVGRIGKEGRSWLENKYSNYYYFVNSYYCEPEDERAVVGVTNYDEEFCSVVIDKNIVGTQFHPEKSDRNGIAFLGILLKYLLSLKS